MEQVYVIAVKSFVNGIAGSVTKKQKLLLPKNIATEFEAMGLVVYEVGKPVPTEPTQDSETSVGTEEQSASLPVETALPTTTLPTSRRGRRGAR